jgi:hypothetical protein
VTDGKINRITAICCTVCGRVSERPLMGAEGEAEGERIVICPDCLSEGDVDAKLEREAARLESRLESRSRWLRALIGRLEVPFPVVLKEFAGPEDIEQAAMFWKPLNDLLDESELLPIDWIGSGPMTKKVPLEAMLRHAENMFQQRQRGHLARRGRHGRPTNYRDPCRAARPLVLRRPSAPESISDDELIPWLSNSRTIGYGYKPSARVVVWDEHVWLTK